MKGNVFSQWLKEFCALVFTQTVQAFLLAIILTIVIVSISNGSGNGSKFYNVTVGGILAIIALTSISKIESLIKKLFGLESSITDTSMKGGKGGVLGTIAAMKMAKKVLDNGPKIATGIRDYRTSTKKLKNAELDRNSRESKLRNRYLEAHANGRGDSSSSNSGSTSSSNSSRPSPALEMSQAKFDEIVAEGGKPGEREYDNALRELNSVKEKEARKAAVQNSNSSNQKVSPKDRHKFEDDLDKIGKDYKDEIEKIKKERRNSVRAIASGLTETAGSIFGGATGAIVGAATGDNIMNTTGIGMGIGDVMGKQLIDIPADLYEHKQDMKDLNSKYKNYKKNIDQSRRELDQIKEQMKNFNAGDI